MNGPSIWNYDKSVERVKSMTVKWSNLTVEIVRELYEARDQLSRKRSNVPNGTLQTWETFLRDSGIARTTAHNWLERFVPEENKLLSHEELQEKKQIEYLEQKKGIDRLKEMVNIRMKTKRKVSGWNDEAEAMYQRRLVDEKEMMDRINKAFEQKKPEKTAYDSSKTDDLLDRIGKAIEQQKEVDTIFQKINSESLRLTGDDNWSQAAMFLAVDKYFSGEHDKNRKIEMGQNLIKYIRNAVVKFQQELSA